MLIPDQPHHRRRANALRAPLVSRAVHVEPDPSYRPVPAAGRHDIRVEYFHVLARGIRDKSGGQSARNLRTSPCTKKRLYHQANTMDDQESCMATAEQYVVDENGNKVAVILPLTEYQHLKEDLHDLAMVAERRDEGTISLAELKKRVM